MTGVKLVDLVGTKYLTINFAGKVAKLLEEYKTVDFADARITMDVANVIRIAQTEDTNYYDSENAYRDKIFKENMRRLKDKESRVPLRAPNVNELLSVYLASLSTDVVYIIKRQGLEFYLNPKIEFDEITSLLIPTSVLVNMMRPNVQIDYDMYCNHLFNFITRRLKLKEFKDEKDWILLVDGTTLNVSFEGDTIYMPFRGYCTFDTFIESYEVIPAHFGRIELHKDKRWDKVYGDAIAAYIHLKELVAGNIIDYIKHLGERRQR
ncbi:MAG: hypothetical protein LBS29_04745 [Endomicrobium sp.]|jgi:hypothetical protein|nr:hypothetical protein [Endomicrobium sp.]